MYIYRHKNLQLNDTVIGLGNFDGVHIAHKQLINKAISAARQNGCQSMIYTFSNHTRNITCGKKIKLLTIESERSELISRLKPDILYISEFTQNFAEMMPLDFIKYLKENFNMRGLVVGYNYTFGKGQTGDVALLMKYADGFNYTLTVIPPVKYCDITVSSTEIRDAIRSGSLELANQMLGYAYGFSGIVTTGRKVGSAFGFPTANIIPDTDKVMPPKGVYASQFIIDDNIYDSITNIGTAPTFIENGALVIETYIFNFNKDIYGNKASVNLLKMLRPEKKFDSVKELTAQIEADKANASDYFIQLHGC